MKGYATNIEEKALQNEYFREVIHTEPGLQLVVMSLNPGEDIGEESHDLTQFIRVEKGQGVAIIDGVEHALADGVAVIIPPGTMHNIINSSTEHPMKLYTVYAPANHKDGTVHKTKADAMADEHEHFEG